MTPDPRGDDGVSMVQTTVRTAQGLRRRHRFVHAVVAVVAGLIACEIVLAGAIVWANATELGRGQLRSGGTVAAVVGLLICLIVTLRRRSNTDLALWCASHFEGREAERVRTAIELAIDGQGSSTLVAVAVGQGAKGLLNVGDQVRQRTIRAMAASVMMLAMGGALLMVMAGPLGDRLRFPPPPERPAPQGVGTLVGDLQLRVTAPDYTQLLPITMAGGEGEFLQDSTLTLAARPLAHARDIHLEMAAQNAKVTRVQLPAGAEQIKWRHLLKGAFRYRFGATGPDGGVLFERSWRKIAVKLDAPPHIKLRAPTGEREVRATEEVVIEGTATDDLGLSRVELVVALPSGRVQRRQIAITTGDLHVGVHEALTIAKLKLEPGQLATLWLEASDRRRASQTVSSQRTTLRMFSPQRHHERLLQQLAQAAIRWTFRLADRLERSQKQAPVALPAFLDRRALLAGSERTALAELGRIRDALSDDLLALGRTNVDLKELTRRLAQHLTAEDRVHARIKRTARGLGAKIELTRAVRSYDRVVGGVERSVLNMTAIAAAEHRATMVRQGQTLQELEKQLETVLGALKKTPKDARLLARAERLIDAIGKQIAKLEIAAMHRAKLVPNEHFNTHGSASMPSQLKRHGRALDKVRAALRKGRFGEALAALKRSSQGLSAQLLALRQQDQQERTKHDAALDRLVKAVRRGIIKTEQRQASLQADVKPAADAQRQAAADHLRRRLHTAAPQVQRLLDDARDQIRPRRLTGYRMRSNRAIVRSRAALSSAQQAMSHGEVDRAMQALLEAREQLALSPAKVGNSVSQRDLWRVRTSLDRASRAAALLRELMPAAPGLHDEAARRRLRGQAKKQDKVARKLRRTIAMLRREGRRHPALQRQVGGRLQHAAGMMRQSAGALTGSDATRADEQMTEVRGALAQARKLLEQGRQRMGGPPRGRQAGPGSQQQGSEEGLGRRRPSAMRAMSLQSGNRSDGADDFRREVLKAMKRPAPAGYDERLRRYYRGLTGAP